MNQLELRKEILDYEELFRVLEELLRLRHKFVVSNHRIATDLCELYAVMGAYQILACMGAMCQFETADVGEETENHCESCEVLPKYERVTNAARELFAAHASADKDAASDALRAMGVLALCPSSKCIFERMEFITQRVAGRPQQVFLVDLSRFAAKLGDHERASEYVQRARTFDPNSWELYNIHMVEGLIALNTGRVDEAVQSLALSIGACLAYEKARAQCCIRAPNLELAEKLLDRGEREAVLRHLLDCQNIWEILQPHIDTWIHIVKHGGKPDFQATGSLRVPEKPSHSLRMQWMNACCLAERPVSAEEKATAVKSAAARRAEHEQWMLENQHILNAVVSKTIAYLDKDLAASTDQSPTNPADSDHPE